MSLIAFFNMFQKLVNKKKLKKSEFALFFFWGGGVIRETWGSFSQININIKNCAT